MSSASVARISRNTRLWQKFPEMNQDFIDLLVEKTKSDGYCERSLKPCTWKSIRETLFLKYPEVFNHVGDIQKFVKNHWNVLKKKYAAYRLCLKHAGDMYNQTTGMFTFDAAQWECLRKINSEVGSLRQRPLEHLEQLETIFSCIYVSTNDDVAIPLSPISPTFNPSSVGISHSAKRMRVEPTVTSDPARKRVEPTATSDSARKRVEPTVASDPARKRVEPTVASDPAIGELVNTLQVYLGARIGEKSGSVASSTERTDGRDYSMASCLTIIATMGEVPIEKDTLRIAYKELGKTLEYRKSFISLTNNDQRVLFLDALGFV